MQRIERYHITAVLKIIRVYSRLEQIGFVNVKAVLRLILQHVTIVSSVFKNNVTVISFMCRWAFLRLIDIQVHQRFDSNVCVRKTSEYCFTPQKLVRYHVARN